MSQIPYATTEKKDELDDLQVASRLIESLTDQPCLLVRTDTMWMDIWNSLGVLPQPGADFTEAVLDGEAIRLEDIEFDSTTYRVPFLRRDLEVLKLTGTFGWGTVTDKAPTDDDPIGTVYSNDGVLTLEKVGLRVEVPEDLQKLCRLVAANAKKSVALYDSQRIRTLIRKYMRTA